MHTQIKSNDKNNRPAKHGKRPASPLGEFLKKWSADNGVTRSRLADSLNMRPTKLSDLMTPARRYLSPALRDAIRTTTGISPEVLDQMIPTRESKKAFDLARAQAKATREANLPTPSLSGMHPQIDN